MVLRALALTALCSAGIAAPPVDYTPLMDVVKATWPTKTHIGVVADYRGSAEEIQCLADAAGSDAVITVLDTAPSTRNMIQVSRLLINRIKPDYVVLLRHDAALRHGAYEATFLIGQALQSGIPSVGTTAMAVRQGAVFAMGAETGNELLVTPELKGTIHVILPVRENFREAVSALKPMSALRPMAGSARIERLAFEPMAAR